MNLLPTLHGIARVIVLAAALGPIAACASNRVISDGPRANLMLKGYDPAAYFTDGKPIPGKVQIATQHDGLDYRFTSEEHKKMFLAAIAIALAWTAPAKCANFCAQ